LTVSPICDRDGNVVGVATIARDVSQRLRYQIPPLEASYARFAAVWAESRFPPQS
jgi:hypothetical protein